ncbi:hypothetical protein [Acuticoccus yangtzensis]|uniref:hypothetical protein n=1 Tax=Acuticoccus yangtzensis TaxID=1443441 RepID=UPI000D3E02CB|nr:hypothetical protein [Acuticoccus yangtzensis]
MVEQDDEEGDHSIEEFSKALFDQGSVALWGRLRKAARFLSARSQWPDDEDALLQEAITRVLQGRRPWPMREELARFLVGVMKSVASEKPKIGFRPGKDAGLDAAENEASAAIGADGALHEKQVKQRILALFDGHDDQIMIVEGRFEGMEKSEFLELFDNDETRYQTACKGIRRTLNKHPDLRGLINGG